MNDDLDPARGALTGAAIGAVLWAVIASTIAVIVVWCGL